MKFKFLTLVTLAAVLLMIGCGKSDADLTKAVNDKLAAEKITGVTATVKDGVATLTGEVADIAVKNKAKTAAGSVEGVKSVTDSTTTKPQPIATPAAADPALTGKISENLKKAECTGANVAVVNGVVTVMGEVPAAKFQKCMQVIQEAGITGLKNELKKGS